MSARNTAQQASRQAHFAAIPGSKIPRSRFPVEFDRKLTFNAGDMVPVKYIPMLPGDQISADIGAVCRLLSPLTTPMMDNLYLDWFVIFGANRLLWEHWVNMQGERENPDSSVDYVVPWLEGEDDLFDIGYGGVADNLGFPIGAVDPSFVKISALPHRLYRLFWNQWCRDQVYQDSVPVSIGDGPDIFTNVDTLLKRGKRHDYFTSALDAPQMGAGVPIPWNNDGQAPVYGDGSDTVLWADDLASSGNLAVSGAGAVTFTGPTAGANIRFPDAPFDSGVYADVGSISATLNALRTSIVIQQIAELDKRGGVRFIEILRTRWNVITKDERLQRIEYVAGGSQPIGATNVVQTSETTTASPQGRLTAYMKGGIGGHFSYRAPEHGYLMILVNARAKISYQQQLDRHLTRSTRFDFPEPLTMHLGEEPVFMYEIYYPETGINENYMNQVWGWQERWAVDRYTHSFVSGLFRSTHPQSLDNWHLALDFGATPPIHDGEWIQDDPPVQRVILATAQPTFLMTLAVDGYKVSSMPVYSVPGLTRF